MLRFASYDILSICFLHLTFCLLKESQIVEISLKYVIHLEFKLAEFLKHGIASAMDFLPHMHHSELSNEIGL